MFWNWPSEIADKATRVKESSVEAYKECGWDDSESL